MKLFLAALLLVCTSASADSATQTDWSGGPGVTGPVPDFAEEFAFDTGTGWFFTPGEMSLYYNPARILADFYDGPRSICSGDIDGDGDDDVVSVGLEADALNWWQNDSAGVGWIQRFIADNLDGAWTVSVCDPDGDLDLDVLCTANFENTVSWWENVDGLGNTWSGHFIPTSLVCPDRSVAADIDGDGDEDVVCGGNLSGFLGWWKNQNGLGDVWGQHQISDAFYGIMWVDVADVDSDGDQDVIGSSSMSGTKWWENEDGFGGTWTEHLIDASFDGLSCARPCDLDGDLDVDIIGAAHIEGVVCWWENQDGLGVSWLLDTLLMVAGANDAYPADVDSDGQQEILYAASSGDVGWIDYNEISPGEHWINHIVCNDFQGACSTCPGDFDELVGTGIAASSIEGGDIRWWPAKPLVNWSGNAESSILDTQASPDWGMIDWTSLEPPGTSIGIQVRASDTSDIGSMGSWSSIFWTPGSLEGVLSDGDRYFQYMAVLATSTQDATPTLFDVTVSWDPLSAGEGPAPTAPELVRVSPNPCAGAPAIQFGLPWSATVEITLFDISGRVVQAETQAEYESGWHTVQLGELRPGVYFVRMRAGEFTASQRFVVVD